jgi:hypothetical protein
METKTSGSGGMPPPPRIVTTMMEDSEPDKNLIRLMRMPFWKRFWIWLRGFMHGLFS